MLNAFVYFEFFEHSLALLQVQAIICGAMAGILTMAISQNASPTFEDVVTVIASMVITAMVAAFIFGLFTFCLVLGGDRVGCDPGKVFQKRTLFRKM